MIYVFAQPWVFESAFCKSVRACVCWPMKYERIKFYYIVWAILGFGLKHTLTLTQRNVRTANKRKVQSQTITLSINKNPARTHTHTRGTANLLEINDGNVSVTVTWAAHPQAFPVISHTKLSTGNFELRLVGVRRRVRLGLCNGFHEFVIMDIKHGTSIATLLLLQTAFFSF